MRREIVKTGSKDKDRMGGVDEGGGTLVTVYSTEGLLNGVTIL